MALEQASIVPHPPILIPSIGKENLAFIKKTIASYEKLNDSLIENKIKNIIIISSHGKIEPCVFSINEAEKFKINFEEFGDYSTKMEVAGNKKFIQFLKEGFSAYRAVHFINEDKLDHGHCVPVSMLFPKMPEIKITPITISGLPAKDHFDFGKKLKAIIEKWPEKTAIIASGDLSHTLTKKSPAGYSPKATRFDQKLIDYIQNKKTGDILNFKEELIEEVKPCGLKSIIILLGAIKGENYEMENIIYESPFGVGYLSMQMKILKNNY